MYETPGGTILRAAHMDLEGMTVDREVLRLKETLQNEFSRWVRRWGVGWGLDQIEAMDQSRGESACTNNVRTPTPPLLPRSTFLGTRHTPHACNI